MNYSETKYEFILSTLSDNLTESQMFQKEANNVHINLYFTIVVDCQFDVKVKVRVVTELNQSRLVKAYFSPQQRR